MDRYREMLLDSDKVSCLELFKVAVEEVTKVQAEIEMMAWEQYLPAYYFNFDNIPNTFDGWYLLDWVCSGDCDENGVLLPKDYE